MGHLYRNKMINNKKLSIIIAAGGNASRFGSGRDAPVERLSKQFVLLNDKPLLFYSLEKFIKLKNVIEIIIVTNDVDLTNKLLREIDFVENIKIKTVEGGKLRQDSVFNGFCVVDNSTDLVVIHDVARPLFQIKDLEKCIETALRFGAAILAVPVVDTIKSSKSDKDRLLVKNTVDRMGLFMVQTPQVFSYNLLSRVYKLFKTDKYSRKVITDEANMIEILGEEVELIPGDRMNMKITFSEDLKIAEAIINSSKRKGLISLSGAIKNGSN